MVDDEEVNLAESKQRGPGVSILEVETKSLLKYNLSCISTINHTKKGKLCTQSPLAPLFDLFFFQMLVCGLD